MTIFIVALGVVCLPSWVNVQAYNVMNDATVFTFPTPQSKPVKVEQETRYEKENDLSKKRAMVAALGLYLGLAHAAAPSKM